MKRLINFTGWRVVAAAWLAVFCLFGYRATFAILKGPMEVTLGWSAASVTLGYSLMMVCYALTAYASGAALDRWGPRPLYASAAMLGALGFALTARVNTHLSYLLTFGLLGGIATGLLWITATISVRKHHDGASYGAMWGLAFAGAPIAQFLLSEIIKPRLGAAQIALEQAVIAAQGLDATLPARELVHAAAEALRDPAVRALPAIAAALHALDAAWRSEMRLLSGIVLGALLLAAWLSQRATPINTPHTHPTHNSRAAFATYAIWGAIFTFLTSMMAEFLIWTQIISYWVEDVGYTLEQAAGVYAIIGLMGMVSMPALGRVADAVVRARGHEAAGRKIMLIIGPLIGAVACALLLQSHNKVLAYAACLCFAIYWAIMPGGVVGYVGAIYGSATLGQIWGLATLLVMGIGPFAGSFIGGQLRDLSGSYTYAIYYALGSFVVSLGLALTLPHTARPPVTRA